MKITYYAAMSLDGYIAGPDGDVSWLERLEVPPEYNGYESFFSTVDSLVMGRRTFDFIYRLGTWPYASKPAWVCTSRAISPLPGMNLQPAKDPVTVLAEAESAGLGHLWLVGGGILASGFLIEHLLTDIFVVQMPVILGSGTPLFAPVPEASFLKMHRVRPNNFGMVEIQYRIGENS